MQVLEPHWGRQALDFVDAIEALKTTASVVSPFERMIGNLGFHACIMAGIPTSGQSLKQLTVANGWPAEWFVDRLALTDISIPLPPSFQQAR